MAGVNAKAVTAAGSSRVTLPQVSPKDPRSENRKDTNSFFTKLFPQAAQTFGPAFLQSCYSDADGLPRWLPLEMNVDFFASALGGDKRLGHQVVFYKPEGQFYFNDPCIDAFCPTTEDKLEALLSYYLIRCAQESGPFVEVGPIFTTFRESEQLKKVINRAKALLAADSSFFHAAGGRKRIVEGKVIEATDKPAHSLFIDEMLTKKTGNPLTVADAFQRYLGFCNAKGLPVLSRPEFKRLTSEAIRQKFGIGFRRDVPDQDNRQQEGWIGISCNELVKDSTT